MQTEVIFEPKPPYVSLSKMGELFDLLAQRNFSEINTETLVRRGFADSVAAQAILGLKFLGLIDSKGNTTESVKILSMKGEGRSVKYEELIRNAYKKIFERVPQANLLPRNQLFDEFVAEYNLSPRLAESAAPLFLWLCSKSGMKVSEDIQVKKENSSHKKTPQVKHTPVPGKNNFNSNKVDSSEFHVLELHGVTLTIPKSPKIDDALIAGKLAGVREKIIEFAEEVGLKSLNFQDKNSNDV